MKIAVKIYIVICVFGTIISCTSVNEDDLIDIPVTTVITYEANIRPITQGICTECHRDPPINNAPMPLTTSAEVRSAIETRGLIDRINDQTSPMPPAGLLPVATRELFQQWIDGGFIEQ